MNAANRIKILLLAVFMCECLAHAVETECPPLSAEKKSEITSYVIKRYRVPSSAGMQLKESSLVEKSCYRKLVFDSDPPKRPMILYLSPDQEYLTPVLYDLRVDPIAEERAKGTEAMKSLLAEDSPSLGSKSAAVTLVEFSDFQCPYCKRFTDTLHSELLAGTNSNVRVIFKHYPLPTHPWALLAAKGAACIGFQSNEAFWKFHDYLFDHQRDFSADNIREQLTKGVQTIPTVKVEQFSECMDKDMAAGIVSRDMATGKRLQVTGTPTFFVNGMRKSGAITAEDLDSLIHQALEEAKPTQPERTYTAHDTNSR